ncbi:MAG: FmdE family protein [Candidatus Thermoplasmatota archaeon]|jgi:hypothetical protein|nr:FmdE family protein [Candidatus Thermoplasmatota archaeon]MDP7265336.1 FmdE family protein [Candidatus Thermoplasmatota archaeon]
MQNRKSRNPPSDSSQEDETVFPDSFHDIIAEVQPVIMREPLGEILGAFSKDVGILAYGYSDVVKLTGHACPTTAGAYLCCKKALEELYPDEIPTRGEISVKVHGEPDEATYGVMAQVITLITGAAGVSGFKGLGHEYRRKDLLQFTIDSHMQDGMSFEFQRRDNGSAVLVKFHPERIPFPADKGRRLRELLEKIIWEAAKESEKKEFQEIWREKIAAMLIEEKDIKKWLVIEKRR